jgi:hypothetical protein
MEVKILPGSPSFGDFRLKLIKLTDLKIPENRQRSDFNAKKIQELSDSIDRVGLLQPLVLRNDNVTLVAGERRSRALSSRKNDYFHDGQLVPAGHAPFVTLGELSPEKLHEAELEENLRRVDLSWQERARAIADLHAFRRQGNPEQTFTDTAREVRDDPDASGRHVTEVSNAVLLSQYLDDPIVSNWILLRHATCLHSATASSPLFQKDSSTAS